MFSFGENAVVLVPFIRLFPVTYRTALANQSFCCTSLKPETVFCAPLFMPVLPLFEVVPSFAVAVPTEAPSTSTV